MEGERGDQAGHTGREGYWVLEVDHIVERLVHFCISHVFLVLGGLQLARLGPLVGQQGSRVIRHQFHESSSIDGSHSR